MSRHTQGIFKDSLQGTKRKLSNFILQNMLSITTKNKTNLYATKHKLTRIQIGLGTN